MPKKHIGIMASNTINNKTVELYHHICFIRPFDAHQLDKIYLK